MTEIVTSGSMRRQGKPVYGTPSEAPDNRKSRVTDRVLLPTRRLCLTLHIIHTVWLFAAQPLSLSLPKRFRGSHWSIASEKSSICRIWKSLISRTVKFIFSREIDD